MNRSIFPKRLRLLKLKEFYFVFQQPARIQVIGLMLLSRSNQLGRPRIGLAISKKYIKHAHDRNRIKRFIRETFRINQHSLMPKDFVVIVHSKDILYLKNADLIKELNKLWYHHFITIDDDNI